jgi:N-acetylglucosaminyl-diphospho-decaprenol L-rhamnosyltransferase
LSFASDSNEPDVATRFPKTVIDVTVSIVHASRPDLTLQCLESLRADLGRRSSLEVVVLDNAAQDGLGADVQERYSDVRVIVQPWRAGFGANQNTIIRSTKSRYVFVLNPDTRVPAGTIDGLVEYLDTHPEAAVAGPLIRGFDGEQQGSAWRLVSIPVQSVWALTLGRLGAVVSRGTRPRRVGAVSASAMLVRRGALERIGLFDESYFMFNEEAELARRLDRIGLERHYVPHVEVLHHGQVSTASVPERQVNETWRSLDIYLGRYHSALAGRVIRGLTGVGYALAVLAAEVGTRLPSRLRRSTATSWDPRLYRLHARNAFRGTRQPDLRQLAEEWNRSQGVAQTRAATTPGSMAGPPARAGR